MQDFLTVFKKNKGAKPIAQNFIRVPEFDTDTKLDSQSFVLKDPFVFWAGAGCQVCGFLSSVSCLTSLFLYFPPKRNNQ